MPVVRTLWPANMGCKRLQRFLPALILFGGVAILTYSIYQDPSLNKEIKNPSVLKDSVSVATRSLKQDVTTTTVSPTTVPARQPRVLCLILGTMKRKDKMEAANNTWSKRCDIPLFVISRELPKQQQKTGASNNVTDKSVATTSTPEPSLDHLGTEYIPGVLGVPVPDSRPYLPKKVQKAFEYAYRRYNNQFDWILKCDDDTYVIMENLKLLLSKYDPTKSQVLGIRFKPNRGNFMSGGAGYVISSSGISKAVENGYQSPECRKETGNEDVEMGKCFRKVGVEIVESRDEVGKETFHPEPLDRYLHPAHPNWLYNFILYKPVFGPGCCSRHSITFHHLKPSDLYLYETLLYGVNKG